MVGIIDYGAGNFGSVWNAISSINVPMIKVKSEDDFSTCSHLILPGVGTYGATMDKLRALNLIEPIHQNVVKETKPFLGICVGMQILSSIGFEHSQEEGLDLIAGEVKKINIKNNALPLPHIGWNDIAFDENDPLFKGISDDLSFYFVHSYEFKVSTELDHCSYTSYGGKVVSSVQKGNIFGVQFHPEKSQHNGLKLLENFINI